MNKNREAKIKLNITYVQSNLSPKEYYPTLFCYLDTSFKRKKHKVMLGQEGDKHSVVVTGNGIPNPDSSLCFSTLSWRDNSLGNNGVGYIKLTDIATNIQDGSFSKVIPLQMYTSNCYVKSVIRVNIDKKDFMVNISPNIGYAIKSITPQYNYNQIIGDFIKYTMSVADGLRETFPGVERMRVPYDYSESGIETTKSIPLPAVAYVQAEVPTTNSYFWVNAFENVMARDNLSIEHWHQLNNTGKARATILTVCYLTQYLDYTADTIDTNTKNAPYSKSKINPREDFSSGLETIGTDCEDDGSSELQCFNAFIGHKFPSTNDYDIYREMQHICRHYIPPLSLDNVRGQQVSDETTKFGAHMNDNFIPVKTFQTWLNNTKEGRQVNQGLSWDPLDDNLNDLPFLVGEGTGMYEPVGYNSPKIKVMRYIYMDAPSLNVYKKPILHKQGEPGQFFVGSLEGYTDYFYRRGSAKTGLGFWYCTKNNNNELSRGVTYDDMMNNRNDRIAIKVQPTPPKQVVDIINEGISRRIPPDDIILTEGKQVKPTNHYLDRLVKSIKNLNRPIGNPHIYAPIYVRPHHLSDSKINAMIQDLTKKDKVWKVDYRLEKITDNTWGFETRIYASI